MIVPTAASWNALATIERETREHEAGHAAAAHLLGFEVGSITLDRWGDFDGELGSVHSRWTGPIDDIEELSFRRAVVAAAGPFVTDSWALDRSRQDCRTVEELRFRAWSPASWEFVVLTKTERLVRSEPFRPLLWRIVAALERVGDVGTLAGDELREVLVDDPRVPPPFRGHRASHDGLPGARVEDERRSSIADGESGRQAGSGSPTQVRP